MPISEPTYLLINIENPIKGILHVIILFDNQLNEYSNPTPPRTSHQSLPLHRQTQSIRQQQIKNAVHSHHPLHLPHLLPNTHLWSTPLLRQWPLLLDASHPSLQQRHTHGIRSLPSRLRWMDTTAPRRYTHDLPRPQQPPISQTLLGLTKITCSHHRFRIGLCLHMVRSLWFHFWNWRWQRYAYYHTTHCFRIHRHSPRWYASKRIRTWLGSFAIHSSKYIIKHCLAFFKSDHNQIWVWYWIWRIANCSHSFATHQT